MRTAHVLAASSLVMASACRDQSPPTAPRELHPSFSYTASAGAAVILDAYPAGSNFTIAYGINDLGVITGVSSQTNLTADANAVRWETGTDVSPASTAALLVAANGGIGRDINIAGQIAGEYEGKAALFTPNGGGYTLTDIGSVWPTATMSAAFGINASGQVVGNYVVNGTVTKCFLWTPTTPNGTTGTAVTLSDLGGDFCVGNEINDVGQIAGSSTAPASGPHHAIVWSSTLALTDLLPGTDESYGTSINNAGEVVGYHKPAVGPTNAALWTPKGSSWTLLDLPAPALSGQTGVISSAATDINDAGFLVGDSHDESGNWRAFFWHDGTFTELPDPGVDVVNVAAISNLVANRAIVAGSDVFDVTNSHHHGLRWVVTLTPPSLEGCFAQLPQLVTDLRDAGTLSAGEANSLLGKIDAASRQADQGKTTAAKNVLNALINEVNAMRGTGRLSSDDAQALIDAAQCAIAGM